MESIRTGPPTMKTRFPSINKLGLVGLLACQPLMNGGSGRQICA